MARVPLVDLRVQYQAIKSEIDQAVLAVLDRGQFILGPEVDALEREMAAFCGTSHGIAVASGTDALELSLRALGIGAGDHVITTALSFFATAEVIALIGAVPVFVDVDPETGTLDPSQIESRLTARTKAILPVHLYGQPCDLEAVMGIARARGLAVLEDCAQAIGAEYRGRRVGSFGAAAAFSFYPSKNLGAYGDGGMVVTSDAAVAERVRLLRNHGDVSKRYTHLEVARNSRLDEIQAAILRVKLRHLEAWNEARRRHARLYGELCRRHRVSDVVLPVERPRCRHVYHCYAIRVRDRDRVRQALLDQGIAVQIHYPPILPSQPALAAYVSDRASYPVAEAFVQELISLPMYPELTARQIEEVIEALRRSVAP